MTKSIGDYLAELTTRFAQAGIESPAADAEILIGHVLELNRGQVQAQALIGAKLDAGAHNQLEELATRRANREPLQHITGVAHFRQLELAVGRGVFVPRPETESVAQLAIDALRASGQVKPLAVDLGTGSGAIALAMAVEVPEAEVYAVEKSTQAFPYTRKNFEKYEHTGARLILGDLRDEFAELDGLVDVVASNPPYIPSAAIPRDPEVRDFDPELALYGGADGMDVIHVVSATAKRLLKPGGFLVIEHADTQAEQVCQLLLADGWREVQKHRDLTDRDRAVSAKK
ncbi:MAG: peptide chain release factor N(5)-glutamine methyltransferase [Actinomycetales bacterium]|nr:peptide chain release factor N(5)-glutamine methyltransferase [Actinomycetales bacterium]